MQSINSLDGVVRSTKSVSLGRKLEMASGIGPGFDHLRIGLSLSILFWHSFGISYGLGWTRLHPTWPMRAVLGTLLPMFFSLSGFLIMGSALRTRSLRTFITFRVLRIAPALLAEITLSVLILGPLLTTLSLHEYVFNSKTILYFGSLIGRVSYVLPGLFVTNPSPEVVNGALWTVGPEIFCYILVSFLMLIGLFVRPGFMLLLAAGYMTLSMISDYWDPYGVQEVLPTRVLILSFLFGNIIYMYREYLVYDLRWAACAFVASIALIGLVQYDLAFRSLMYTAVAGLAYVVAVIGLTRLPPIPLLHNGDYSYGVYIYGYPIQQTITHFLPGHRIWWINFALAAPLTLLFAIGSWHLIEKPMLGLRRPILRRLTERMPAEPKDRSSASIRKVGLALFLIAYGVFVADAARIFPLRPIAKTVLVLYATPGKPLLRP